MSLTKQTLMERHPAPVGGQDDAPISRLRSLAQVQRLRRRQRLALLGGESVYVVRSGLITVEGAPSVERRVLIELLYPGDIVVPTDQAPISDIGLTTATPAEFWRISASVFSQELTHDGTLAASVFHRLNGQRARMQLHVAVLGGLSSEQRVAALLIEAACRLGVSDGETTSFDMPLSRTEVAEYLSLNADTLSRIMSRLTNNQIISRTGRAQMTIRDWPALLALCPASDAVIALHRQH